HGGHLAGERREDVVHGLHGLHDAHAVALRELLADVGKLREHDVGQRLLRVIRDADAGAVPLDLDPLVVLRVTQVLWDFGRARHGTRSGLPWPSFKKTPARRGPGPGPGPGPGRTTTTTLGCRRHKRCRRRSPWPRPWPWPSPARR